MNISTAYKQLLFIGACLFCITFFGSSTITNVFAQELSNASATKETSAKKEATTNNSKPTAPVTKTQEAKKDEKTAMPPVTNGSQNQDKAAPKDEKKPAVDPHAYRIGFTSLNAELKYKNLPIEGTVPTWLYGSLIVAGPGKYEINNSQARTWLDGFAMLHRFSFNNGKVSYVNKFVETNYYNDSCKKGAMSDSACPCDPNASYFTKLAAALSDSNDRPPYDNANVNVVCHDHAFFTITETPGNIAFDRRTLKTKGRITFKDNLKAQVSCAHPFIDPQTGEWINFATTYARKSVYTLYKMGPKSLERIPLATIPVSYPSYMHSFSVTQHYIILIEIPFVVSAYDLAINGKPYIENFNWKPKQETKVSVFSRSTGNLIKTYSLEPFFTLHQVNAFEDGSKIIIDLIAYPDNSVVKSYCLKDILNDNNHVFPQGTLKRITIDTAAQKIQMQPLNTTPIEMPRINPDVVAKRYSYVYGLSSQDGKHYYDRIVKINTINGSVTNWNCQHCYPSEAVFVASPTNQGEDDGVLLSIVLDGATKKSFLLILDAKTMKEIGRVNLEHHIPFTVHGNFFAKPKATIKEAFDAMLHR